jgi:hypothetical protein
MWTARQLSLLDGSVGGGVAGAFSSGPPTRRTETAHALKAGIREWGSSVGSVSAFALARPPQ